MSDLIARLAGILLLRLGPQDLPAGRSTLLFCVTAYVAITAINLGRGEPHPQPVLVLLLAVGLPLLLVWIVLKLRHRPARWEQTLSALFGTSALLSILTLPLSLAMSGSAANPLAFLLLLSFFWSFAVDAHIWRSALEISFAAGLAVAVLMFLFSLFLITSLAGPL
ncbi:hypothetical protein [Wenzhouxiangella marina]|uniref:Uncharacterized protein n=1 Tax=Wenzhouxiangella marina TaxID=1579979 RepID=A0A0K0XSL9_9GAMM|nr:hypothetical protein [Wenzhouxiangella marina]AKS40655.1 hypothetical protein WM2015_268 [Wenzhouxiangella marina]MBB6088425.1 membrane protein YdbS with pleckstrin-like domain [Wenzhouxiangella marina]